MTPEELEKLIAPLEWEHFQQINDGNIHCFKEPDGLIRFCYRVGLHLKRPMEAIMAKGDFIRMRAAPQFAHFNLMRLDPENVDTCMYDSYHAGTDTYSKSWHPKYPPNPGIGQAQYNPAQQALLNQYGQLQGIGQTPAQGLQGMSSTHTIPQLYGTITTDNTAGGNSYWLQGLTTSLGNLFKI